MKFLEQRRQSLGDLLICARKLKEVSREELAEITGFSASVLARIEFGKLTPSVLQWKRLTQALEIPMDSLKSTLIDRKTIAELRSIAMEGGFRLPKRYAENSCIKVRELLPYFAFVSERRGWEILAEWLQENEVSPAFFSCMDHQVNFKFYCDFVTFMFEILKTDENSAAEIASYSRIPELHGSLIHQYRGVAAGLAMVKSYLSASAYY